MYFKFNTKKEAFDFIVKVNEGEGIIPTMDNVTTSYAQPVHFMGAFYIIADKVTEKYTELTPLDLDSDQEYENPTDAS